MDRISEKYCPCCRNTLPAVMFSPNSRKANGLQVYCRRCRAWRRRGGGEWKSDTPPVDWSPPGPLKKLSPEKAKATRRRQYERWIAVPGNKDKKKLLCRAYKARKKAGGGRWTRADIGALMALQRGKCTVCRSDLDVYHVDHIMPLVRGGLNDRSNLQLLCPSCNLTKQAKHPADFMRERGYLL